LLINIGFATKKYIEVRIKKHQSHLNLIRQYNIAKCLTEFHREVSKLDQPKVGKSAKHLKLMNFNYDTRVI